jgi:8-oxo-dGTP diphosphatase
MTDDSDQHPQNHERDQTDAAPAGPRATVRGPLPQAEFDWIFSRVPRLTVEVVIASAEKGVLLTLRDFGPCRGLWHLPGGTVRFGEPAVDAVARVARDELGVSVTVGALLGYIEYPSHYEHGLDSPVGLAFETKLTTGEVPRTDAHARWFPDPPEAMHDEQRRFLGNLLLRLRSLPPPGARTSPGC